MEVTKQTIASFRIRPLVARRMQMIILMNMVLQSMLPVLAVKIGISISLLDLDICRHSQQPEELPCMVMKQASRRIKSSIRPVPQAAHPHHLRPAHRRRLAPAAPRRRHRPAAHLVQVQALALAVPPLSALAAHRRRLQAAPLLHPAALALAAPLRRLRQVALALVKSLRLPAHLVPAQAQALAVPHPAPAPAPALAALRRRLHPAAPHRHHHPAAHPLPRPAVLVKSLRPPAYLALAQAQAARLRHRHLAARLHHPRLAALVKSLRLLVQAPPALARALVRHPAAPPPHHLVALAKRLPHPVLAPPALARAQVRHLAVLVLARQPPHQALAAHLHRPLRAPAPAKSLHHLVPALAHPAHPHRVEL